MKPARNTKPCNPAETVIGPIEMPSNPDLESAVLGALLLESRYIPAVRAIITRDAFYEPKNGAIFDIVCHLDDKGERADLYTVCQLARTEQISASYLAQLTQKVGSGVQAVSHAKQLAELYMRRQMILFTLELMARAQSDTDVSDTEDWARQRLDNISDDVHHFDGARNMADVIDTSLQELEHRQQAAQHGECVGIPTGLAHLDRITGGWRGGQLVVVAGRPAMGKTAVSLLFARAAAQSGIPVCYYSLEMPDVQLAGRMLVGASRVDAAAFRSGTVSSDDWRLIESGAARLRSLPLYLFDKPSVTMTQIRIGSRAMQRKGRCGMVVIDYLQLIASTDDRRNNREREVAEISRSAKLLAKELNIPVILLAQLSRKVEERTDKTPLLSDLRESGAIEQDADMVIFIDRPAVYGIREFNGGNKYGTINSHGVGRLTIAKNREGGTGFIPFRHNESLTSIWDFEGL